MIRLGIFILLAIVLYKLLASLIKSTGTSRRVGEAADEKIAELVRDPQCGTYLLPSQGVSARVADKVHHFCSETCRDRFLEEHSDKSAS